MHKLNLKESSKIIWNTYVIQILLTLTQLYITRVGGGTVFLYQAVSHKPCTESWQMNNY